MYITWCALMEKIIYQFVLLKNVNTYDMSVSTSRDVDA